MSSQTFLIIVGILFIGIGTFSIILARRRRKHGSALVWHKDLTFLTGMEYLLLGLIIFFNLSKSYIPNTPPIFHTPFYLAYTGAVLLAVAFLLTVVIAMFRKPRRSQPVIQTPTETARQETSSPQSGQRQRQRRQNAAAARRRHTGRA